MVDDKMIQYLQDRFSLSKVQASVIYFKLQEHFTKEVRGKEGNVSESLKVS